jgi:hypothetical protein
MSGTMTVSPGPQPGTVRDADGQVWTVPEGWALLAPGDAGLTRRVKATGPHWVVQERKGRRTFSRGVWALATTIDALRAELNSERDTDSYRRKRARETVRREGKQTTYVTEFRRAVLEFLAFHPRHEQQAQRLAEAVTAHATPVGSGTVARTERIPVERRAESAVIAWLRHQTTAYDSLHIPRVKGKRREVRRALAEQSRQVLARYRQGSTVPATCPLQAALARSVSD